jgi:hypothetical protein
MAKVTGLRTWRNGEIINARDYVYERNLIATALNTNDDTLIDHETRITEAEADIVSLDGRLDVAEADIDELQREEHLKLDFYGKASGNLAPMDIVMFAGVQGDHILMTKANVNSVGFKPEYVIGMVETAINNGDFGRVRWFGLVENVAITEDAESLLWLSQTIPGAFTTTEPTSGYKILVAVVEKQRTGASSNGKILVRPTLGSRIEDLHNTNISVTPTGGDILLYENGEWINSARLVTLEDAFDAHILDLDNPHQVTQSQVGLSNVNNTSDLNKPISTATQTALDLKADLVDGKVPANQLPSYVDDVLEVYVRTAAVPLDPDFFSLTSVTGTALTPESGKIYMVIGAVNTNLVNTTYRWGGTHYAVIGDIAIGTTAATAFPGDRGLATETKTDNIVSGTQTLTNTRITNSATGTEPFIVNGIAGTTSNLFSLTQNNAARFTFTNDGYLRLTGLTNISGASNAFVELNTTGSRISRNVADANPSLIVNQANASSTGDILRLQSAGANVLEITRTGGLNQNGTRLFHQTAGGTFFGASSGNLTITNFENTAFGKSALSNLTSGANNVAVGSSSLNNLTTGASMVAIGRDSGLSLTTATNSVFVGRDAGNNASQLATASNSTGIGYQAYTDKSNQMVFGNASVTEILLGRGSANVGIGTTAPDSRLSIQMTGTTASGYTSTSNAGLKLDFGTGTNGVINLVGGGELGIYHSNSSGAYDVGVGFGTNADRILRFDTAGAEKMRILANGNVGIGTSNPNHSIQIDRNNFAGIHLNLTGTSNHYSYLDLKNTEKTYSVVLGSSGETTFGLANKFAIRDVTASVNRLVVNTDGLVGINETSPSAQLQVKSGATTRVPLIVDTLASQTEDLQKWRVNGSDVVKIDNGGRLFTNAGVSNRTNGNNSAINLTTNGTIIERNIADSNPALIVNLANAGASANVVVFQKAGSALSQISNAGIFVGQSRPTQNEQTGNYTLALADEGKVLRVNSSSNRTITIPKNSAVAFPIDTEIAILRYGTGTVSIAPVDGDVTLQSADGERKIRNRYGSVALKKIGTDEWVLVGSLEA